MLAKPVRTASFLLPRALVLAVALLVGLFAAADSASAGGFEPTGTITLTDTAAGANSDIVSEFNVPATNYNFGAVIGFTPTKWVVANGADIPDGTLVAKLTAQSVLGLLDNPCKQQLTVRFDMMDATLAASPTTTFDDQFNLGGGGLPDGVTKYPDYLLRIFEGLTPIARQYGQTPDVPGTDVSLNFVLFPPGTTFTNPFTGAKFETDAALGYPSVTILQNLGDPDLVSEPTPVTDFCSPLATSTTTYGSAGGGYRTNPGDGKYLFTTFTASQRDADGDGHENGLDPCPFTNDSTWNPRSLQKITTGDDDGDGMPNSCDPTPTTDTNLEDHDADGYQNRGDNCPAVANGQVAGQQNQKDTDRDGIGDICDTAGAGPSTADGEALVVCVKSEVTVGAGGAAPTQPNVCNDSAIGIDLDGDGVFDSLAAADADGDGVPDADDRCAGTPAGSTVDTFGCTATQAAEDDDDDGVLNAADSCPSTPAGETVDANGCSASQLAGNGNQNTDTSDNSGGPTTGVGALAPVASSIPTWAAIASGLGGAGFLGGLSAIVSRLLGIRLPGWRRRSDGH